MNTFIFLCCFVAITIATPTTIKWDEFKVTYHKTYENPAEENKRLEIFFDNVKKIEEHNKLHEQGLTTYKMGVNHFADWTHEEFVAYLTKHNRVQHEALFTFQEPLNVNLPKEVDWRKNGSVTPVKDQGGCGSCWAFSSTGSLEGQNAIRKGKLVSLSEQELVDCSRSYNNSGCEGGSMEYGFDYVKDHGLTTEQAYPYEATDKSCRRGSKPEAVRTRGYVSIPTGSESSLLSAVATVGPISVAVDASSMGWQFYFGGIFTECGPATVDTLDHGVLVVGYTDRYWIVKNSWGPYWGENGYIRLPRNQDACGIALDATYPLLA